MSFSNRSFVALAAAGLAPLATAQISFDSATNYPLVGLRPDWVATGDFDRDGDQDFAVTSGQLSGQNGPDRVEVFQNAGNGTFTAGQVLVVGNNVSAAALVAADLDRDGDTDLAVSLKDSNSVLVLVNSGGVFAAGGSVGVNGVEPRHMAGADMDADGDIDLIASNRESSSLSFLRNAGNATFTLAGTIAVGGEPRHVALDDLNGDCEIDIAVAAHDDRLVQVLFNSGNGTFGAPVNFTIPGNERPSGMVAADLDDDGDVDLVATSDNNDVGLVAVMTNNGSGGFTTINYPTSSSNPDSIVAGDFDADGDTDLATADEASNLVSALPNSGAGTFGAATTFPVGLHPSIVAAADFDGNGSLELVTANRDTHNASVLLNDAAGGTHTYCTASANSAGAGARIDSRGSLSIGANGFTLAVRCAPANQPGLFFFGDGERDVPFGNGRLCVGAPLSRLNPPVTADGSGRVERHVDFTQGSAGQITAGSTWNFQFWYRDPAGGGAFYNTSDALSATFRP